MDVSGRLGLTDVLDLARDAEHRITETGVPFHLPTCERLVFADGEGLAWGDLPRGVPVPGLPCLWRLGRGLSDALIDGLARTTDEGDVADDADEEEGHHDYQDD